MNKNYFILNGNVLNTAAFNSETRVNILTNRVNKTNTVMNTYNIGEIFKLTEKGPYIWATEEQFRQFCVRNKLNNNNNIIISENPKFEKESNDKTKLQQHVEIQHDKENILAFDQIGNVFPEDIHEICRNNIVDRPIVTPTTTNPHDLDRKFILSLTNFRFNGLSGNGVVCDVIDGDTIDLIIYVNLSVLSNGHNYKYYSKKGVRSFLHTKFSSSGFFTNVRCRLNGCDAMEKNTPEGKFAKALTIDLYQRIQGKVWFEFPSGDNIEDCDKYGRTLVKIYKDRSKRVDYTNYLFQYNFVKEGILIVEKYDGGKKSEYSKQLALRKKEETDRITKFLQEQLFLIIQRNQNSQIHTISETFGSKFLKFFCLWCG